MFKRTFENIILYIRKMGLRKKVIMFALLIYVMTCLLSTSIFTVVQRYSQYSSAMNHLDRITNEKLVILQDYFLNMNDLAYNIAYSNWVQDICLNSTYTQRRQELLDSAHNFMGSLSILYEENQFAVIALNGTRVTSTDSYKLDYNVNITEKEWYEVLLRDGFYLEAAQGSNKGIYKKHEEWNLTLYYVINDYNTLERTGFLVITIPEKNLMKLLKTEEKGMDFCLICSDNRMITTEPEVFERLQKSILDIESYKGIRQIEKNYYVAEDNFDTKFFNWKLIAILNESLQKQNNRTLTLGLIFILYLSGSLVLLGAFVVSRYLTKPILDCASAMKEIKNSKFGILLPEVYKDEIGILISGFNEMSMSLEDLIEKNKAITAIQKESEMKILESQINPHFLFNTLEIINSLILNDKEQEAIKVCETLGQLYRYNLNQEKWITLRREVDYTKQYLLIVKYKLNDLEVYFDIDEQIMDIVFLKMILQPLVENSVRHGFQYKVSECCISISITQNNGRIHIEVMDNGRGMEKQQLAALLEELNMIRINPMEKLPESIHIGLRNVVQRLYLEYGNEFSVEIVTNIGYGLRIVLELPIIR